MPPGYARDLRDHVDRYGNIAVHVEIGGGPGAVPETRGTGSNAVPVVVARFLRELAADVERAGEPCPPASAPPASAGSPA